MSLQRWLRIRYVILSFVASFFVWAVLYLFLAVVVHPYTAQTIEPAAAEPEIPYQPREEDGITVLFMGLPAAREAPGAYLLARFDPAGGRVTLAALPPHMQVLNDNRGESLTEVYSYGGVQYTRELLAKALGIRIDRYVRLTPEGFLACADAIGSVEYILPEALRLIQDGARLELGQGLQLLDGSKALLLLRHGYTSTKEGLSAMTAFAAGLVEQRRDVILSTFIDSIFESIINQIDSDISYADYMNRKPAGEYLAELPGPVTRIIEAAGSEQDGRYLVSDTFIAELRQYF